MASITLKALPPKLHRALKSRAALHKRSLNQEVVALLEAGLAKPKKIDIEKILEEERLFRESLGFQTTPEEIDRFKKAGRDDSSGY